MAINFLHESIRNACWPHRWQLLQLSRSRL